MGPVSVWVTHKNIMQLSVGTYENTGLQATYSLPNAPYNWRNNGEKDFEMGRATGNSAQVGAQVPSCSYYPKLLMSQETFPLFCPYYQVDSPLGEIIGKQH